MSVAASPATLVSIDERVAAAVQEGLTSRPKRLPAWLFYDAAGSRLFEAITELPEYYLTRTERGILAAHAGAMIAQAANGARLRITELGAGSAEKTRLLLKAAVERQKTVVYEPVDVSASALDGARERIEREIPGVTVAPRVMDYTDGDGAQIVISIRQAWASDAWCFTSARASATLSRNRPRACCDGRAPGLKPETASCSASIW